MNKAQLRLILVALMAGVCFIALSASPTLAQAPLPEDQMYEIAKQLNCPTCAGRNLADCPTDTCTQWKQEIVSQLQAGKSDEEVLTYFKERFGIQVLQEPPKEGFVLLMWVVPVLAVIALVALAVVVAQRAAAPAQAVVGATPQTPANDYETQLEQQVKDAS